MKWFIISLALSVFLSGCATTPDTRSDNVQNTETIANTVSNLVFMSTW